MKTSLTNIGFTMRRNPDTMAVIFPVTVLLHNDYYLFVYSTNVGHWRRPKIVGSYHEGRGGNSVQNFLWKPSFPS